jgi:hypothetical protein
MPPRTRAAPRPSGEIDWPAGLDPAQAIPRPDLERRIHEMIRPLGGTQVWAYAMVDLDPPGWLVAASVQVDVRASSKPQAWRRADTARRAVMSLPLAAWPEGVVNRVDVVDGPFWLPDPNGAPRYVARYRVVFHPRTAAGMEEPPP